MNFSFLADNRFSVLLNRCSSIAYFCLLLFFIDFLSFGSGEVTQIYSFISTRELFFAAAFLFAVPLMWYKRKELIRNIPLWLIFIFLCLIVVNGIRGYIVGNDTAIIASDILGFLSFVLFPVVFLLLYNPERLEFLMQTVIVVCAVWALCSLVLTYYCFYPPVFADRLYLFFEENTLCSLTSLAGNGTRVFFHTASRYMFPAFLFAAYFLLTKSRGKIFYLIAMILYSVSLFYTYSRAICFGAVFFTALFTVFFFRKNLKKILVLWLVVLVTAAALLGVIGLTQDFNPYQTMISRVSILGEEAKAPAEEDSVQADSASTPSETDNTQEDSESSGQYIHQQEEQLSLDTREERMAELKEMIAIHPLIGSGLGASIAVGDGYVEYFYHDMLVKNGMIGLVAFLLPFLYGSALLRKKEVRASLLYWVFLIDTGFFLFISYFNPCMNSVTGISCYILFLTVASRKMEQNRRSFVENISAE